ncbi:MAG: CBS domain-containing protein [Phycisphaerales bacterium]|nr:CBS domain-containing protein [Phycisphaerales bacterium]MCB9857518.1 CBS domain-containing protein [Phycisphaerales bacterium]MCB9864497.1 CBS domain-containing protein [Phycisphaerales bacterium]
MGEHDIQMNIPPEERRQFVQRLLTDVQALEEMLRRGMIESGFRRIGAEQELIIVGPDCRPKSINLELLERLNDPELTTELARFNIEHNLAPLILGGDCLRRMESLINEKLSLIRAGAAEFDADVVLTGILPTLESADLRPDNMTPLPRYAGLDDALMALRGGPFQFVIKGMDELSVKMETVLVESCNTSFQVHFQVRPDRFANLYNVAQAISAPVLAAAVNSPLLFGRRLWKETRIAVFHQSVDARDQRDPHREVAPRVSFGTRWVDESAIEIYQEDISRFRVLFVAEKEEDPFACIERGVAPKLKALQTHNSTVYRWNRVCYGVTDDKPHLRIENRYLPSGPTTIDEIANAAFWFGLMAGVSEKYDDVRKVMDFDTARTNFFGAAQQGLRAQFTWIGKKVAPAQRLILDNLLPLAHEGLQYLKIDGRDIDRYLGVIEARVASKQTGATWMLESLARMSPSATRSDRLSALTCRMAELSREGDPVHEWPLAKFQRAADWTSTYARLGQFMTTDLFTVNEEEVIDLVANLMDWRRIRHVPVEDDEHRLVGLVSYRTLLRHMARNLPRGIAEPVAVRDIMIPDPYTATPDTTTLEAITIMREHSVACLPIVEGDKLVGIVTEHDMLNIAAELIESSLKNKT